jgi:hypothetical protein
MSGWLGNLGKVSERFKEQAASFAPIANTLTNQVGSAPQTQDFFFWQFPSNAATQRALLG